MTESMQQTSLLNHLIKTAIEAGGLIMQYYSGKVEVDTKNDDSPVTKADREADKFICDKIQEVSKDLIISEEGNKKYNNEQKFWLVDPLDGTKSFIKGEGSFTVNIALIENSFPTLGIIFVPAKRDLYFTKNCKSYFTKLVEEKFNYNDEQISKIIEHAVQISTTKRNINKPLTVIASKSHLDDKTQNFINSLAVKEFITAGSSIKFCLVAKGDADIYPRFAPTMLWDTAAGQAILEQAGGTVKTQEGSRFSYKPIPNDADSLRNNYFICRG
jgi:3'(2'), 5'-bisphosphate nucleotidase